MQSLCYDDGKCQYHYTSRIDTDFCLVMRADYRLLEYRLQINMTFISLPPNGLSMLDLYKHATKEVLGIELKNEYLGFDSGLIRSPPPGIPYYAQDWQRPEYLKYLSSKGYSHIPVGRIVLWPHPELLQEIMSKNLLRYEVAKRLNHRNGQNKVKRPLEFILHEYSNIHPIENLHYFTQMYPYFDLKAHMSITRWRHLENFQRQLMAGVDISLARKGSGWMDDLHLYARLPVRGQEFERLKLDEQIYLYENNPLYGYWISAKSLDEYNQNIREIVLPHLSQLWHTNLKTVKTIMEEWLIV